MSIYQQLLESHQNDLKQLSKRYNLISALRFLCIAILLFFFYWYYKTNFNYCLIVMALAGIVFFVLLSMHQKLARQVQIKKALLNINKNEISFLNGEGIPFKNGTQFETHQHFYTYDLDVFDEAGLFQHLNRTATYIGSQTLADLLKNRLSFDEIKQNQLAVKVLSDKVEWRQQLLATASILEDKKEIYEKLIKWSETKSKPLSNLYRWLAWLLTALMIVLIVFMFITANPLYLNLAILLFVINLGVVFSLNKMIRAEINYFDGIDKITKQYGFIIEEIEGTEFEDAKLNDLKQQLASNGVPVSKRIRQLSSLIAAMDSVQNLLIAILFNGFFLFHIHVLHNLLQWKKQHAGKVKNWLSVIGEFETISSLANFSYNNPEYCFPQLNNHFEIEMTNSGHPLLRSKVRINNDASFNKQAFMILTGSNMSGKSTFLRSLGVNMLLCNIGSCICATSANIHPLPILVSMRLSDSLAESESYFFAEVKRLKLIMQQLNQAPAFVLLDEILRGTNSDDKRNGTIGVIKKLIQQKAIGAIATHDLEICKTTLQYPNYLSNHCFEVEIINDELVFDYKLREGICQNQSASFLMTQMEII